MGQHQTSIPAIQRVAHQPGCVLLTAVDGPVEKRLALALLGQPALAVHGGVGDAPLLPQLVEDLAHRGGARAVPQPVCHRRFELTEPARTALPLLSCPASLGLANHTAPPSYYLCTLIVG